MNAFVTMNCHYMNCAIQYNLHPQARETIYSAGRSFLAGFVLNSVISDLNFAQGLAGGCVSVLASIVDSAVKPILACFLNSNYRNSAEEFLIRNIVVLAIVTAVATPLALLVGSSIHVQAAATIAYRLIIGMLFRREFFENYPVVI